MSEPLRVAFSGGGTGGHIYPALAIDEALRAEYGDGYEPRYFGNRHGLEARVVTAIPLVFVPCAPLRRRFSFDTLVTIAKNLLGVAAALRELYAFRPHMVVATGGYVCFPVVLAARLLRALGLLRCALGLLQIDVRPGLTNRLLAPLVDEVWTTYEESAPYFRGKAERTGAPVRSSFAKPVHAHRARLALGLAPERTTIVVLGGSQGARSINEAVAALVTRRRLGADRQVLHVSGERDHAYMEAEERDRGDNHVLLLPYLSDPAPAYAAADVAVTRSGASTLAELAATGTPSILVPYPFAVEDDQGVNASLFAERGAALVIADRELDGDRLWWALEEVLAPERLAAMRRAARALGLPDAAASIVRRIAALVPLRVDLGDGAKAAARD